VTLATAQLHGQTLRQIVFIRIATNVTYALSKRHDRCADPQQVCLSSPASWEWCKAVFTRRKRDGEAGRGAGRRMAQQT